MILNFSDGEALTVTLEQAAYIFSENAAPDSVMVCVDLMETSLNRIVDIQLTLRQGSALSECLSLSLSLSLSSSLIQAEYHL